ncbi:type II toxin-antitoxin system RelB family antitoxin [Ramlibacter sp.]|uniref:type II toxin-antitoxin system RelB family antitoxin n=1 Tax=Ramlibacter sp. TaxID=1917967 RepID=UPI003D10B6F2
MTTQTIDHSTLTQLVQAGTVRGARVVGQDGGWILRIRYGAVESVLAAHRSRQARMWRRLETLVSYLKEMGIARFDVDASAFDPTASNTYSRPDRAEAMKRAHEAVAYDAWFREEVQASIDDARPGIPHEHVSAEMAARKAALRRGIQAQGKS